LVTQRNFSAAALFASELAVVGGLPPKSTCGHKGGQVCVKYINRSKNSYANGWEDPMQYSILCLFDSDSAIERLRLLAGSNCTVIAVKTVLGALQEFKKCNADMVLVQVGLKDESCFDFLRAAQPLAEGKNVPMVAVSLDDV
jgi:PleD family two-component response regulator